MSGYESSSQDPMRELREVAPQARKEKRKRKAKFDLERDMLPYQIILGGEPIKLTPQEYRFLLCLAERPYHVFSPRQVLRAINDGPEPKLEQENLRTLMRSLRDKLGFFWDFVQYVPNMGWRFKP